MSRKYLVFGSDDGINWELLNTVDANGSEQALNKARDQTQHRHYGATPERNWSAMTPEVVERAPVVRWKPLNAKQMTVDEFLPPPKEKEEEGDLLDRAKDALAKARGADDEH